MGIGWVWLVCFFFLGWGGGVVLFGLVDEILVYLALLWFYSLVCLFEIGAWYFFPYSLSIK